VKQNNKEYSSRLIGYGYSLEEVDKSIEFRDSLDHCTFDIFTGLFQQGLIIRKRKLKKKRNLFTDGSKFYYLDHYTRQYEICGEFKE